MIRWFQLQRPKKVISTWWACGRGLTVSKEVMSGVNIFRITRAIILGKHIDASNFFQCAIRRGRCTRGIFELDQRLEGGGVNSGALEPGFWEHRPTHMAYRWKVTHFGASCRVPVWAHAVLGRILVAFCKSSQFDPYCGLCLLLEGGIRKVPYLVEVWGLCPSFRIRKRDILIQNPL
jgi:hypothetical protein